MAASHDSSQIFFLLSLFFGVTSMLSLLIWLLDFLLQTYEVEILRRHVNEKIFRRVRYYLLVAWSSMGWFSVSVSFTIFNKWFMQYWHSGFDYPILLTTVHMGLKVVIARAWVSCDSSADIAPLDYITVMKLVVPIGVLTSADIALSNLSILYIPLSLYTAMKTTVPIWTYIIGIGLKIETFNTRTFLSIFFIVLGLSVAVQFSTNGSTIGVVYVSLAALCGAMRWVLLQILIETDSSSKHVMVAIYRFSPSAFLFLIPIAVAFEMPRFLKSNFGDSLTLSSEAFGVACCGAVFSIFLIGFEIIILRTTSSVTLGILGQLKEMMQITLSMLIFSESMNLQVIGGLCVSLVAVNYYRIIKTEEIDSDTSEGNNSEKARKPNVGLYVQIEKDDQLDDDFDEEIDVYF